MSDAVRFGSKVRALRRREGLSQADLAAKLGVSASYLNLIEHNRRPLSAGLLIKLAQAQGEHSQDLATVARMVRESGQSSIYRASELLAPKNPSCARSRLRQ